MAASEEKRMIVGLDIGTSKVVAVVGEIDTDGTIDIVGIGSHPSKGLKKVLSSILSQRLTPFSERWKKRS